MTRFGELPKMKDYYYDKMFNIQTSEKSIFSNDHSIHNHPYEPTSYEILEHLFKNYEVNEGDHFVDFGCGLGRFMFYVHHFFRVSVTGVEGNEVYYKKALENKYKYDSRRKSPPNKLKFIHCLAEEYTITNEDNCFYFFHPFSIHIFRKVVQNIIVSVENNKRKVDLILYYAHDDYIYYLENETLFELVKEIEIPRLSDRDAYERILIYQLAY